MSPFLWFVYYFSFVSLVISALTISTFDYNVSLFFFSSRITNVCGSNYFRSNAVVRDLRPCSFTIAGFLFNFLQRHYIPRISNSYQSFEFFVLFVYFEVIILFYFFMYLFIIYESTLFLIFIYNITFWKYLFFFLHVWLLS